jgi:hypothetical protein
MMPARTFLLGVAIALAATGCGYHFPGGTSTLPGGGTRIHVREFANATQEASLVAGVQNAFESEVARRGNFALVSGGSADVILTGTIRSLDIRPVGFSQSDEALQYETVVTISARLEDTRTKRTVWRIDNLRQNDSYGAAAQTVVTQSSQFQEQSTLSEANLQQLSDVQVSESQRGSALERVCENLARELYNAMAEDF